METQVLLTRRQNDVLQLLKLGMTDLEIAWKLNISPRTVQDHIEAMGEKFGVRGRGRIVSYAYEHGL